MSGDRCRLVAVKDSSVAFLQYVSRIGLVLSSEIRIEEIQEFDSSMLITYDGKTQTVTKKFAEQIKKLVA